VGADVGASVGAEVGLDVEEDLSSIKCNVNNVMEENKKQ
jgi:hypothetical protein